MRAKVTSMSKRINFDKILSAVEPLKVNSATTPIHIVNVVANVELLLPGEMFCLEQICVALSGTCKYEPRRFAAAILRKHDGISTTTCLAYRQGKLVVVSARGRYHSMYACQVYRQLLEGVECVYRTPDEGLGLFNLKGRTNFYKWSIQNIVANANLGLRPDLKILSEIGGETSTWNPEIFPACIVLIWLKPKNQCKCVTKKQTNESCQCTCRALIFDTGKMVLAGCKSVEGMNKAFELIKSLFEDESLHDKSCEPAKAQRFQARRQKIIDACVDSVEWKKRRNNAKVISVCDEITIENLLKILPSNNNNKKAKVDDHESLDIEEAFVRAAVWGEIHNVKHIAAYDTRYIDKALKNVDNSEMRQLLLNLKNASNGEDV